MQVGFLRFPAPSEKNLNQLHFPEIQQLLVLGIFQHSSVFLGVLGQDQHILSRIHNLAQVKVEAALAEPLEARAIGAGADRPGGDKHPRPGPVAKQVHPAAVVRVVVFLF